MEQNTIVDLLERSQPHKVVIETSNNSNWIYDICQEKGYTAVVANPNQEAWQWRNIKRKTDKDDALKLAKLAALDQISPVYVPSPETRQYRQLVKYRKKLVWRMNEIKNRIRALLMAQGICLPTREKAWSLQGMATLGKYRKSLADCQMGELWKGELDIELSLLDTLETQHNHVEKQLN